MGNRAQRLEEQKERERLDAEKAESEEKRLTMLGAAIFAVIVIIIAAAGFAIWKNNQPKTITVTGAPSFVASDGAIVITKNGVEKNGKAYDNKNTGGVVRDYQDFLCPGCGSTNRLLGAPLRSYIKNNNVILKEYPITMLDRLSNGTKYSTRLAAAAYRVAELSPRHYLDFIDIMFSKSVQPSEESFKNISDAQLQKYLVKAGLTTAQAKRAMDGKYEAYVTQNTQKIAQDRSLWRTAGGQTEFMTPIVMINNKMLDFDTNTDVGTQLANMLGIKDAVADGDGNVAKK